MKSVAPFVKPLCLCDSTMKEGNFCGFSSEEIISDSMSGLVKISFGVLDGKFPIRDLS